MSFSMLKTALMVSVLGVLLVGCSSMQTKESSSSNTSEANSYPISGPSSGDVAGSTDKSSSNPSLEK